MFHLADKMGSGTVYGVNSVIIGFADNIVKIACYCNYKFGCVMLAGDSAVLYVGGGYAVYADRI